MYYLIGICSLIVGVYGNHLYHYNNVGKMANTGNTLKRSPFFIVKLETEMNNEAESLNPLRITSLFPAKGGLNSNYPFGALQMNHNNLAVLPLSMINQNKDVAAFDDNAYYLADTLNGDNPSFPVTETPDVALARKQHLAAHAAAIKGDYSGSTILPKPVQDTPEVMAAKKAFFTQYKEIEQRLNRAHKSNQQAHPDEGEKVKGAEEHRLGQVEQMPPSFEKFYDNSLLQSPIAAVSPSFISLLPLKGFNGFMNYQNKGQDVLAMFDVPTQPASSSLAFFNPLTLKRYYLSEF